MITTLVVWLWLQAFAGQLHSAIAAGERNEPRWWTQLVVAAITIGLVVFMIIHINSGAL